MVAHRPALTKTKGDFAMADSFKPCSFSGCNGNAHRAANGARGWCNRHYNRWLRHGAPDGGATARGEPLHFLKMLVAAPPSNCVTWPFGGKGNGYGAITLRGKSRCAHRVSWELYHERPMQKGLDARHLPGICHNRGCVNPLHVCEGTRKDNCEDMLIDGTRAIGEAVASSKLTAESVREIRDMKGQKSQRAIAADFGVSAATVSLIHSGKSWAWLDT